MGLFASRSSLSTLVACSVLTQCFPCVFGVVLEPFVSAKPVNRYKSIASEREDLENQLAALQAMLAAEHGAADDPSLAGESGPLSDTPAVALTGTSDLQAMAQAEAAAQTQIDEERRQIRLLQEQEVALDEEEKREKERLRRRQAASSASAKQRLEKIVAGLNKKKKSYGSPHDSSKASDAVSESTTLSFSVDDIGVELKVYRARFAMHYLGKVIDFDPHKESQHRIHFKKSGEKPWYNMHQHQYVHSFWFFPSGVPFVTNFRGLTYL